MQELLDLFISAGPWAWLIFAVFLFALEIFAPGIHFVWFGVSAAVVGGLLLALGDTFTWPLQLSLFTLIAVTSVFVFRRYSDPSATKSDIPELNVRGAQYIGRSVTVAEAIINGRGKVNVDDTVWQANGPDVAAGTRMQVVGVDGVALVVDRPNDDDA